MESSSDIRREIRGNTVFIVTYTVFVIALATSGGYDYAREGMSIVVWVQAGAVVLLTLLVGLLVHMNNRLSIFKALMEDQE